MRKTLIFVSAALCLLMGAVTAYPQDPEPPVVCSVSSFEPEVVSFHGDSATVLKKLEEFKEQLPVSKLRVYMFLVETADSAELSLFERADHGTFNVSHWTGRSAGDLRETITNRMLANRGIACIGEQSKALVAERITPVKLGTIPSPVTARAAFGHSVQKYGDKYMRLSVFLFC
ncbi:MAG TPA: hypothetical protein VN345_00900 [Blastocatellia bacterium]|jgi:hypothetical protein|nr:hypothetical protein [Blastocatellia bacterium]